MPTILKREFAPISDLAWKELDSQAQRVIVRSLTGRKVVDLSGPHGWELAAVNLGRLKLSARKGPGGVPWATRDVLPLVEARMPFELLQLELDNVSRGAADADIRPLQEAAAKVAHFEDAAIFTGFAEAGIPGILKSAGQKPIRLPKDVEQYPKAVAQGLKAMAAEAIGGPYALALGPDPYFALMQAAEHGYPPHRTIEEMTGGEILMTPVLAGGVLLSTRGGDFELSVGKDYSIGYASHNRQSVELFITESFTFRTLEPMAAVELKAPA